MNNINSQYFENKMTLFFTYFFVEHILNGIVVSWREVIVAELRQVFYTDEIRVVWLFTVDFINMYSY